MRFILSLAVAASALPACAQQTFGPGAGGPIADATNNGHSGSVGETRSIINVSMPGSTIVSLNSITINGIQHGHVGELSFQLTHVPTQTSVIVHDAVGFVPASLNGTYTFVVNPNILTLLERADQLSNFAPVPGGTYAAADFDGRVNYNDFTGLAASGQWELLITDWAQETTGTFQSWGFNATVTAVPEPATVLALAGGTAVLLRRRRRKND